MGQDRHLKGTQEFRWRVGHLLCGRGKRWDSWSYCSKVELMYSRKWEGDEGGGRSTGQGDRVGGEELGYKWGCSGEMNVVQRREGGRRSSDRQGCSKGGTAALNQGSGSCWLPWGSSLLLSPGCSVISCLPLPTSTHPQNSCHPSPGKPAGGVSQPTSSLETPGQPARLIDLCPVSFTHPLPAAVCRHHALGRPGSSRCPDPQVERHG